jgi:hypothetical protein
MVKKMGWAAHQSTDLRKILVEGKLKFSLDSFQKKKSLDCINKYE